MKALWGIFLLILGMILMILGTPVQAYSLPIDTHSASDLPVRVNSIPEPNQITPKGSILFTVCGSAVAFLYAGRMFILDDTYPAWLIRQKLAIKYGEPVLIVILPSARCSCEI